MNLLEVIRPDPAVLAAAVLIAVGVDRVMGEPPVRWHPVVWMGRYLAALGRHISRVPSAPARPGVEVLKGALAWLAGALVVVLVAVQISEWLEHLAWPVQAIVLGFFLKPMMAWRMLRDEVAAVELALSESLAAGRGRLQYLVSRDVERLDEIQVRQAALSTLAENLNDSVVAPLFWFAVAGLPGAALYRFANTADAMWGYMGERQGRDWTWSGRWAARTDDVLSWLPARLTAALLLVPAAWRHVAALAANARRTPSPNGGWPMSALALGLDISLSKPGVYALNPEGRLPQPADTARALRRCGAVVAALAIAAAALLVFSSGDRW